MPLLGLWLMCYLRRKFAEQFADFIGADRIHIKDTGAFYFDIISFSFWAFLALADKFSHASHVAPHFLLCGDLNAKVGGLNEVTHAHKFLLVAHPALQLARWCECLAISAASRLLADLASSLNGILGTGRVRGDMGRPAMWGRLGRR